jgi:hypothetical protein
LGSLFDNKNEVRIIERNEILGVNLGVNKKKGIFADASNPYKYWSR